MTPSSIHRAVPTHSEHKLMDDGVIDAKIRPYTVTPFLAGVVL